MAIELIHPQDPDKKFNLKVDGEITRDIGTNIVTDTIDGLSNQLAGQDIDLNVKTITIQGKIAGMSHDDYPDPEGETIDTDTTNPNHAYAYSLEQAANDWGTIISGTSTIYWDRGGLEEEIKGSISNLNTSIAPATENNADHYTYTLEFTEIEFGLY